MNARAITSADPLTGRVAELAALFDSIARTRMAGVPVLSAVLRVEAVGFEPMVVNEDEAPAGLGILITPWFMNLVRLPLRREDSGAGVGHKRTHVLQAQPFEFIGAFEPAIGAFAACSLFSPMFEFADQAAARDTAKAVLAQLRAEPKPARALGAVAVAGEPPPARRSFLFGRSAAAGARP